MSGLSAHVSPLVTMPTSPVTAIVSGASFTVSVTLANLDIDNTILDYLVLEAGTLTVNPGNYTKTTAGTVIQYSGVALPAATTLEIRRRTPRVQRNIQAVGTKIRSSDWNAEFDRTVRINEEYDVYGAGGGFSVRLPLDAPFSVAWDSDGLFPPSRNAVYDELVLKSNINSPAFTGLPSAPTVVTSDNSTLLATTAHVKNNLISYALLASPAFTGFPSAPTAPNATNSTTLANTAHVKNVLGDYLTIASAITNYALLSNPAFVGTPTAPTASRSTSNTQIANTQFVHRRSRPCCILERITSNVNIPTLGVFTLLTFNNKVRDVDNAYNTSNGQFTAPYAGYYEFKLLMRSDQSSGVLLASITTVGLTELVRVGEIAFVAGVPNIVTTSATVYLAANAVVVVSAFATVTCNVVFNPTSGVRNLSGCVIMYLGDDA